MTATTTSRSVPFGLSVFEEKLHRHLTDHMSSETGLVASYRELAEAPTTPDAARYLLRLVIEDEQRHHRVIGEIATAIGEGIAWRSDADTVPSMPRGELLPNLEDVTKRFLAAERADRKQLQALRKELRPFRDTTMWSLLVEVMELDTAKHIRLLTFIRDHLTRGQACGS
jgi:alkylated DNA nucleotide flippase Atl1